MQYTSIHPEEPGWYWWEEEPGYPPVVIRLISAKHSGVSLCRTEYGYKKITELCGRFAGPIPEPFDDKPWFCIECKHDGNIGASCNHCLMLRT